MAGDLLIGLGGEAALILGRVKALREKLQAPATILAIGAAPGSGLGEDDVAPLERDGQELPHAALATALAGAGGEAAVSVVADLADLEGEFCEALVAEIRKAIGPERRLVLFALLPGDAEPQAMRLAAAGLLGRLWLAEGQGSAIDRLFLAEEACESGKVLGREARREAVALRLAIEGSATPAAAAVRAASDGLAGLVRSVGGVALRYPCRAVAELAAARLGAALVEGWCGSTHDAGGALPEDLPVDDDALGVVSLSPDASAEIEAFLDELVWSLRGRFPQLPALAAALPAELAALEEIQFSSAGGKEGGELDVFVREPRPRSVLEGARDRLARQIQTWRAGCEAELVSRCKPVFLEGGGLARGIAFLDDFARALAGLAAGLGERERIGNSRLSDARQMLASATNDLGAAARKTLFRSQAVSAAFAACRRAGLLYLTTRAEVLLLDDFRSALALLESAVADMRERVARLTGVLTYVQHGLEDRGTAIADAWHGPNLLDPGDPEQAYRDVVGTLPDEEAHLASLHEDFVAGGSVLDLPIHPGDEQHLIDRLHERALLRFPDLLEATFGQGLAQRLPTQALRSQRLGAALAEAAPLFRLGDPEAAGPLPGQGVTVLAHEPKPPAELRGALDRLGFPAGSCAELSRKLADHVVILSERGGFASADRRQGILPAAAGAPRATAPEAPPAPEAPSLLAA
ncbi:MAG: hypothetical protein FJZ01_08910, partial [Candidatus Sericytochromatia bacterium]|nr:hypothetical protein [Candidatus Tanganyikabacteria bacterium]